MRVLGPTPRERHSVLLVPDVSQIPSIWNIQCAQVPYFGVACPEPQHGPVPPPLPQGGRGWWPAMPLLSPCGMHRLLSSGTSLQFFQGCSPTSSVGFSKLEAICKNSLGSTLSFLLTTFREYRQKNLSFLGLLFSAFLYWVSFLFLWLMLVNLGLGKKWNFFCLFHQVWRESKPASLLFLYLKVSCQHFAVLSCLLPLSCYEIKF